MFMLRTAWKKLERGQPHIPGTPLDPQMNTALIENNVVAPKWVANPFLSDSIVFNVNHSVIAALMLTLSVNGP